jgi:FMN phosphatase YigB (HAD superfamily)
MIKVLLFDLSRVLLFPTDPDYSDDLNPLHKKLSINPKYRLFDHFQLDEELIGHLSGLKKKYVLAIFTAGMIQETPELEKILLTIFDPIFSASQLGISKRDPDAYLEIAKRLGKKPREILFIDDYLLNIRAAKSAGLNTIHYQSNEKLIVELEKLLGIAD